MESILLNPLIDMILLRYSSNNKLVLNNVSKYQWVLTTTFSSEYTGFLFFLMMRTVYIFSCTSLIKKLFSNIFNLKSYLRGFIFSYTQYIIHYCEERKRIV